MKAGVLAPGRRLPQLALPERGLAIGGPVFRRVSLPSGNLALEFTRDDQRVFVPDDAVFGLEGSLTLEAWVRDNQYSASNLKLGYIVFRGDDRASDQAPLASPLPQAGRAPSALTATHRVASNGSSTSLLLLMAPFAPPTPLAPLQHSESRLDRLSPRWYEGVEVVCTGYAMLALERCVRL